jgi:hypothetical protein
MTAIRRLAVSVNEKVGTVSALVSRPRGARWLYVVGHGAGAGMTHPFMQAISERLSQRRVATFRYQFPYMQAGRKRPDHRSWLEATVRAAIRAARDAVPRLPIIAGGKSMGGRMTSQSEASEPMRLVRGLAFLGFPLHRPDAVDTSRADHLADVGKPMLFVQGTRDKLADLRSLRRVRRKLGSRATLHVVKHADHGFHVLKRSGRTDDEVLDELADAVYEWGTAHV